MEYSSFQGKNRIGHNLARRGADRLHIHESLADGNVDTEHESFKERRATAVELELRDRISRQEWWNLDHVIEHNKQDILRLRKEVRGAIARQLVWAGAAYVDQDYYDTDRSKYVLPVLEMLASICEVDFSDTDFLDLANRRALENPLYVLKIAKQFNKDITDESWADVIQEAVDLTIKNRVGQSASWRVYAGDGFDDFENQGINEDVSHPMERVEEMLECLGERLDISRYSDAFDDAIGLALRNGHVRAAEGLIKTYFDYEKDEEGKPVSACQEDYFEIFARHKADLQEGYIEAICKREKIDVESVVARTGIVPDWSREDVRANALKMAHESGRHGQIYKALELLKVSGQQFSDEDLEKYIIEAVGNAIDQGNSLRALYIKKDLGADLNIEDKLVVDQQRILNGADECLRQASYSEDPFTTRDFQSFEALCKLCRRVLDLTNVRKIVKEWIDRQRSSQGDMRCFLMVAKVFPDYWAVIALDGEVHEVIQQASARAVLDSDEEMLKVIRSLVDTDPVASLASIKPGELVDHLGDMFGRRDPHFLGAVRAVEQSGIMTAQLRRSLEDRVLAEFKSLEQYSFYRAAEYVETCLEVGIVPKDQKTRALMTDVLLKKLSSFAHSLESLEKLAGWLDRLDAPVQVGSERESIVHAIKTAGYSFGWDGIYAAYTISKYAVPRLSLHELGDAGLFSENNDIENIDGLILGLSRIRPDDLGDFVFQSVYAHVGARGTIQDDRLVSVLERICEHIERNPISLLKEPINTFVKRALLSAQQGGDIGAKMEKLEWLSPGIHEKAKQDASFEIERKARAEHLFLHSITQGYTHQRDEYSSALSFQEKATIVERAFLDVVKKQNSEKLGSFFSYLQATIKSQEGTPESVEEYLIAIGAPEKLADWMTRSLTCEKPKDNVVLLLTTEHVNRAFALIGDERRVAIARIYYSTLDYKRKPGDWIVMMDWSKSCPDFDEKEVRQSFLKTVLRTNRSSEVEAINMLSLLEGRGLRATVDVADIEEQATSSRYGMSTNPELYHHLTRDSFVQSEIICEAIFSQLSNGADILRWGDFFDGLAQKADVQIRKTYQARVRELILTGRMSFTEEWACLDRITGSESQLSREALEPVAQHLYRRAAGVFRWPDIEKKTGAKPDLTLVDFRHIKQAYNEAVAREKMTLRELHAFISPLLEGSKMSVDLRQALLADWPNYLYEAITGGVSISKFVEDTEFVTGKSLPDFLPDVLEKLRSYTCPNFSRMQAVDSALREVAQHEPDITRREELVKQVTDIVQKWCNDMIMAHRLSPADVGKMVRETTVRPSTAVLRDAVLREFSRSLIISKGLQEILSILEYNLADLRFEDGVFNQGLGLRHAVQLFYLNVFSGGARKSLLEAIRNVSPKHALMLEVAPMRKPASREEFCPYTRLSQLIAELDSSVAFSDRSTQQGIMRYLEIFGFNNNPRLCQAMIGLYNACSETSVATVPVEKLVPRVIDDLRATVGLKEGDTIEAVIDRLRAYQQDLVQRLLNDEPFAEGFESTPLAMELFNAFVPHVGAYSSVAGRGELIAKTRSTTDEEFTVPSFLQKETLSVAVAEEGSDLDTNAKIVEIEKRILEKASEETVQSFLQPWREGVKIVALQEVFHPELWFLRLEERWEKTVHGLEQKVESVTNEKGKAAVLGQIERWRHRLRCLQESRVQIVDQFEADDFVGRSDYVTNTHKIEAVLVALQGIFATGSGVPDRIALIEAAREELHGLVYLLMKLKAPAHIEAIELAEQSDQRDAVLARVQAWSQLFYEEYLEHFLKNEDEKTFHPWVLDLVHALWKTKGISDELRAAGSEKQGPKHPLGDVMKVITALRRKKDNILRGNDFSQTASLEVYPVKGLGRALSGDIANACYNKFRMQLMRGDYKKITALLLRLSTDTSQLAGSVLCIDTRNTHNERVLVIRAVNPTEQVIRRELSPDSFLEKMREYFIQAAEEENKKNPNDPIKEVRLCYDHSGGHSTNRETVFKTMKSLLEGPWQNMADLEQKREDGGHLALENIPETNFNGYAVWKSGQTRLVWRKPENTPQESSPSTAAAPSTGIEG